MTGKEYYKILCKVYVENDMSYDEINDISKIFLDETAANFHTFRNANEYIFFFFDITGRLKLRKSYDALNEDDKKVCYDKTRANHTIIYNLALFNRHLEEVCK